MDFTVGDFAQCSLRFSWGLSPAEATLTFAGGTAPVGLKDPVKITVDGAVWYGTVSANPVTTSFAGGKAMAVPCVDYRSRLMDDVVFCLYNRAVIIEDDPLTPGVDRKRKFEHIGRDEWDSHNITRTDLPKTPREIVEHILQHGPTLKEAWKMEYHAAMEVRGLPLEMDAMSGKKFGSVLSEIAAALGLFFTIRSKSESDHTIVWGRRGEGVVPVWDAEQVPEPQEGAARSWTDTQIIVAGERKLHQIMLDLEPDWASAWEKYWMEAAWVKRVGEVFGPFGADSAGQALQAAKAREVTVQDYVNLTGDFGEDSHAFEDFQRWQDVGRMSMPAYLYLRDVVFKTWRVPTDTQVGGTRLDSLEIHEGGLIADVEHDAGTGAISYIEPRLYYPETKAYVVVQGAEIDRIFDPRLNKGLTDEQITNARNTWLNNGRFQIDRKNKTFTFEGAQIRFGEGEGSLFLFPNRGKVPLGHVLYNIAVPNAVPSISAAKVKVCMVVEAGQYSKTFGEGDRTGSQNVSGLTEHLLRDASGVLVKRVPYFQIEGVDKSADEIAKLVADNLLAVPEIFERGEKKRVGNAGTVLTGVVQSITVSVDFRGGISESMSLSRERDVAGYLPRTLLERTVRTADLFTGQTELRNEARTLRAISAALSKPRKPGMEGAAANAQEILQRPVGAVNAGVRIVNIGSGAEAGLAVFTSGGAVASADGASFAGVVTQANARGFAPVATQGIVPVLVKGPVESGKTISMVDGVAKAGDRGKVIGRALEDYAGDKAVLLPVQLGASRDAVAVKRHPFEIYISTAAASGDDKAMPKLRCDFGSIGRAHTANSGYPIANLDTEWLPQVGQKVWLEVQISDRGRLESAQLVQSTANWASWPEQFGEMSPTGNRWFHPIGQVVPAIEGEAGSYFPLNKFYGFRQLTNTHLRTAQACGDDDAMTRHYKLEPAPGVFVV